MLDIPNDRAFRLLENILLLLEDQEKALGEERFEDFYLLAGTFRKKEDALGHAINALPLDRRHQFISRLAEAKRSNDEMENRLKHRMKVVREKIRNIKPRRNRKKEQLFYAPEKPCLPSFIDRQA